MSATVVSLGIHILDILGRPVTRIPPGQHVDLIEEIRLTVAGTAAGTSVDLAKLGARVIAMGAIGKDAAGDFIVDTMGRYGIDTSNLVRKDGVQTSATMLPIRPNGERPALHVLGANAELTIDDVNFDAIKQADFFALWWNLSHAEARWRADTGGAALCEGARRHDDARSHRD